MAVTALSMLLFAVPLTIAVERMYYTEAVTELQRDAFRAAATVPGGSEGVARPHANRTVGVYTVDGRLIRQNGPATSPLAAAAADGHIHVLIEGPDLAVSVPIWTDRVVAATVRVSMPYGLVREQTHGAWLLMVLLGLTAVGIAALLARYEGGRIARPLERLTASARALGDGDFTIDPHRSRIAEADTLADALQVTAGRLGRLLERERAVSTQVSHQLRTPLTALLLGLEAALARPGADLRQAVVTALRRGERLESTIEDLLRLAREHETTARPALATADLLDAVRDHWQTIFTERGRSLRVSCAADLPPIHASATAIRHVVEVLVDNALVHGAGPTTLSAHTVAEDLLIEVSDHGPGLTDPDAAFAPRPTGRDDTHGIGLALARSLVEAEGGRLVLRQASPHPTFGLLLPGS
ncbi:histidine kinase dimerization/phospho-acceptor domain-containing protein [Nocardia sp. NPDC051570]|uniref:HAMP domain-containing sensor histidine kinase n=1 Tax=Nocardia sp. NPDC051570 TaxID=3364324 RepID=UPI0037A2731F